MGLRAKITGTGMYVPNRVVTNDDLSKLMDTSDEWIRQRTGIVERHYIEAGEGPADLAQHASERALEAANLEAAELDCIVLATLSSQADFPGTSFFLHQALGVAEIPCFDLRAQCSGFVYALACADSFIGEGFPPRAGRRLRGALDRHRSHDTGRDVAVLFGDGAGAVVLEANDDEDDPAGLLEVRLHAEGEHARKLWIEAPGSATPPCASTTR